MIRIKCPACGKKGKRHFKVFWKWNTDKRKHEVLDCKSCGERFEIYILLD